ncbi:RNA-directed DNA polymerase, eukaryota, reverse transcriptase zinc-binding domain protein [Tanacetum coccineum]
MTSLPPAPSQPSKQSSPLSINLEPVELIFSTLPISPHPFFDSLEDLPIQTANPPPPQPSFDTIERLANQPPPLPVMEPPLPPLPPHLPPLGSNNEPPRTWLQDMPVPCTYTGRFPSAKEPMEPCYDLDSFHISFIVELELKLGILCEIVVELKNKLHNVQEKIDMDPTIKKLRAEGVEVLSEYKEAGTDEENFLRQQIKVTWLREGDKNSAYFHKVLKGRLYRNKIMSVCAEDRIRYENNDVAEQFMKHFEGFLGIDPAITKLKEEDAYLYEKKRGTSDGLPYVLQKSWETIKGDLCAAIKEFFLTRKLLGEVIATLIAPVPKSMTPQKVFDFRPIACCNVIYKCISKILTNWIKSTFSQIMDDNQSAFIPGRAITDNILLTQELLKGYNYIMKRFGFPSKMIEWIMTCIATLKFTLCVNGERFGNFRGGRGLSSLSKHFSKKRNIYAGFHDQDNIADVLDVNGWKWPQSWMSEAMLTGDRCDGMCLQGYSPKQDILIITTFKSFRMITLTCGDGANDVGALKQHYRLGASNYAVADGYRPETSGDGQVHVVSNNGEAVLDEQLNIGSISGQNGFEWVVFKTNKSLMKSLVTGYNLVFRAMPLEVITNTYEISLSQS